MMDEPELLRKKRDILDLLLAHGGDIDMPDQSGETALHIAASGRWSGLDVADILIAKGADVNALDKFGRTPLHIAAHADNIDVVRSLLAHGANAQAKDTSGKTPLDGAYGETKRVLLEHMEKP